MSVEEEKGHQSITGNQPLAAKRRIVDDNDSSTNDSAKQSGFKMLLLSITVSFIDRILNR